VKINFLVNFLGSIRRTIFQAKNLNTYSCNRSSSSSFNFNFLIFYAIAFLCFIFVCNYWGAKKIKIWRFTPVTNFLGYKFEKRC